MNKANDGQLAPLFRRQLVAHRRGRLSGAMLAEPDVECLHGLAATGAGYGRHGGTFACHLATIAS